MGKLPLVATSSLRHPTLFIGILNQHKDASVLQSITKKKKKNAEGRLTFTAWFSKHYKPSAGFSYCIRNGLIFRIAEVLLLLIPMLGTHSSPEPFILMSQA